MIADKKRRHWIKLALRVLALYLKNQQNSNKLITKSYDSLANDYEQTWSAGYWNLSDELIERLNPPAGAQALDLFCGTGYVTSRVQAKTGVKVIGVDASLEMIALAQRKHGKTCSFVQTDVLDFLRSLPPQSIDIVTCAWGLGYSKPFLVLREISRILRSDGKVGILDNTLFTVSEIMKTAILALAENPRMLDGIIRTRFLPSLGALTRRMQICRLHILDAWQGTVPYYEKNGKTAVDRLKNSSVFAGYEHIIAKKYQDEFYRRVADIVQKRYQNQKTIPLIHRYIAAIGMK